jgi:putative ABC transport system permease protein
MGRVQPPLEATNAFGQSEWSTIIGVVSDIKSLHPQPEATPEVYVSYWQWPMQNPTVLLRTKVEPSALVETIRRETRAAIPQLPAPLIRTMDELLGETVAHPRLQAVLLTMFAVVALGLAAVGLYGLLAYNVNQRQREIGVRMALGARPGTVLWLIIRQGLMLAMVGTLIGVGGTLAFTRVMRTLLYQVEPADAATLIGMAGLLLAVALLACWWPARRAAGIAPMEALRHE